jgi:arylsulfatase A-like enzyme/Flp pilus assembly protein TadD
MTPRTRPCSLALLLLVAGCGLFSAQHSPAPLTARPEPLNVLLITVDTLLYDHLSVLNQASKPTPHIDRLARTSWLFSNAYSHNPITLPAHTNIMTGATSLQHGVIDNLFFRLGGNQTTLARLFKQAGYRTAAFVGAFPVSREFGLADGFDLYDDHFPRQARKNFYFAERPAERVVAPAMAWLKGQKQKWFAWVHLFDPHQPYQPPKPWSDRYAADPYSGEIAYVDSQLGILFDFLEQNKLSGHTLVVFTADHGEALGEKGEMTHGYFAYNNTVHVPLFIVLPQSGARQVSAPVAHIDIMPTLCALLNLPLPAQVQGTSLLPLIAGQKTAPRQLYFESQTPHVEMGWVPLRGFISGSLKYIDLPIAEQYDLARDPAENTNLATAQNVPANKKILADLMQRLGAGRQQAARTAVSSDAQRKMRSLGYVASQSAQSQAVYTAKDDLKSLLPVYNQVYEAINDYDKNAPDMAERKLRDAMVKAPRFLLAYLVLSGRLLDQGRIAEATAVITSGLKNIPDSSELQVQLGNIVSENGDPQKAVELLLQGSKKQYFDPELFNHLGVAYTKMANYDEAIRQFKHAIELDPLYDVAYSNLGNAYMMLCFRDKNAEYGNEAERQFRKALECEPQQASAYNGLGSLYYRMGRKPEAIGCWQKSLAIKPEYNLPIYNLGIAFLESGEAQKALANFKRYQQLFGKKISAEQLRQLQSLIAEAEAMLARQH